MISSVLLLQASEQSLNFNISKMAYWSPVVKAAVTNESVLDFYISFIPLAMNKLLSKRRKTKVNQINFG